MKLTFKDDFTIEHEDNSYSGVFSELTRKQVKAFNKKYKDKENIEDDAVFKERLELSIVSDDKEAIMALGELYSYKPVFDTIIRDIGERKAKND